MISKEQTAELSNVIGHQYATDVQKILRESNVSSPKGGDYSNRYISHVFNGRYENIDIELAIYTLYERKKVAHATLARKKKNLGKKKPEAATPGSK